MLENYDDEKNGKWYVAIPSYLDKESRGRIENVVPIDRLKIIELSEDMATSVYLFSFKTIKGEEGFKPILEEILNINTEKNWLNNEMLNENTKTINRNLVIMTGSSVEKC